MKGKNLIALALFAALAGAAYVAQKNGLLDTDPDKLLNPEQWAERRARAAEDRALEAATIQNRKESAAFRGDLTAFAEADEFEERYVGETEQEAIARLVASGQARYKSATALGAGGLLTTRETTPESRQLIAKIECQRAIDSGLMSPDGLNACVLGLQESRMYEWRASPTHVGSILI